MGSLGKLRLVASAAMVIAVGSGCARQEEHLGENLVKASASGAVDELIGEATTSGTEQFRVLNGDGLAAALASGKVLAPSAAKASALLQKTPFANSLTRKAARAVLAGKRTDPSGEPGVVAAPAPAAPAASSLLVGFPIGLVGERQVFGGVVTKVSDRSNEDLGMLKLADLPPIHVRTVVANGAEEGQPPEYALFLVGCVSKCEEGSNESPLLGLPIVGVDEKNNLAILDVAPAGKELNIMDAIDPIGLQTGYKAESVKAVAVDYSTSTLVFDVQSTMKKLIAVPGNEPVNPLVITARWYLRLASTFASDFDARSPIPGVGFFTTERSKTTRITRFRKPAAVNGSNAPVGVKYFIKNVPLEYRKAFAAGFEQWNKEFKAQTGKPILAYEFVDAGTPEADALVAGDIRYNIMEWDIDNLAPYGGLGPSIANQFTGENLSANVLIQGPTIVELYSKWFGVGQDVTRLAQVGAVAAANEEHANLVRELAEKTAQPKSQFVMTLAEGIDMRVPAQMPALQDPIAARNDFDLPPQGMTYADYMDGYFVEIVAHELGHNLGLRHNFYGNLGSTDDGTEASVSRSIMEYLGRPFRYLNRVRDYDKMAIAYGYTGKTPEVTNHFCTDENVAVPGNADNSAECSRDDATSDPYGYLAGRLAKAVDLLTNAGATERPTWKMDDLEGVLGTTSLNLGLYALSAEKTAAKWTNFFGKTGRPANGAEVKDFVYTTVKAQLCGKRIDDALAGKTGESLETAKKNVEDARKFVHELFRQIGLVGEGPEGIEAADGAGDDVSTPDPLTCAAS